MIKKLLFVSIALLVPLCAWGACPDTTPNTCFVRTDGHDTSCNGSVDASSASAPNCAFLTVQKGLDTADDGDTVSVANGTYYERISITDSGSSGSPITVDGESESGVIIDGSDAVTAGNWSEVASDMYSQSYSSYQVGSMYIVDGSDIWDIPRCRNESSCINTYMRYSSTRQITSYYLGGTVYWWDGIEATFAWDSNTLYVRFGDNTDPGTLTLRVSPENGEVFDLTNDSYITIKDVTIRGAHRGIYMSGSSNIIIDNCTIDSTGGSKIYMTGTGTTDVEIKNSHLNDNGAWNMGGWETTAWNDNTDGQARHNIGGADYKYTVMDNIYYEYKQRLSDSGSSGEESNNLEWNNIGSGLIIHDCIIEGANIQIMAWQSSGIVKFYNNTLKNSVSVGLSLLNHSQIEAYNNLIYDNDKNVRLHNRQEETNRKAYIYNNRFWNTEGRGKHARYHQNGTPSPQPDEWFYHNTFTGGLHTIAPDSAATYGYCTNGRWVNNLFSGNQMYYGTDAFYNYSGAWEFFDYNYIASDMATKTGDPAWLLENNTKDEENQIWDNSSLPSFTVSDSHASKGAGIDITQQFTIDSTQYDAMEWDTSVVPVYKTDIGWINQITIRGHAVGIHN